MGAPGAGRPDRQARRGWQIEGCDDPLGLLLLAREVNAARAEAAALPGARPAGGGDAGGDVEGAGTASAGAGEEAAALGGMLRRLELRLWPRFKKVVDVQARPAPASRPAPAPAADCPPPTTEPTARRSTL
jgi:hypothetical protein